MASRPSGLFCVLRVHVLGGIVSPISMPYTAARGHHMTLLNKVFTTRTLLQIIFILTAMVIMKAASLHYGFSWATALAAG